MEEPKFKHDCEACRFLGHYVGHDVYICHNSLVARDGDQSYASCLLSSFQESIASNESICGTGIPTIPFQEYLFSPLILDYHKAFILAMIATFK